MNDEITLDTGAIREVEHNLAPPMRAAVTIPVSNGVVIYVCAPGISHTNPSDEEVVRVAEELTTKSEWQIRLDAATELFRLIRVAAGVAEPIPVANLVWIVEKLREEANRR